METTPDLVTAGIRWFESDGYGGTPHRWLVGLGVALLVFLVLSLIRHVIATRLKGLIRRTENVIDDLVLELVRATGWPFFLVVSLFVGSLALELPLAHRLVVQRLFAIVLFLQAGLWATRIIGFSVDTYLQDKTGKELGSRLAVVSLFNFFARVIVWSVVVLLILDNFGIDVTTLIAGLGVGGIAIGLALQSVLRDTFASLSIILDKPFEAGDFVIIDEFAGTIEEIGLKTTRLRSISGEQLVFGNDDLLSCRIRNFKRMQERRVLFRFALPFETPNDLLARIPCILREILDTVDDARFDRAHFKDIGEYGLEFEVVYYVQTPDYNLMRDLHQQVNLEVHRRFTQEGLRFAYPTRRLMMDGEGEAPPGAGISPVAGEGASP